MYAYIFFLFLFHYRLLQDIEYSYLCYTVGPCLSIFYAVACIYYSTTFEHIIQVLIAQSCPTLCDPTDCSPPGSSVCEILQARILEWVSIPFSRGSSQSRDRTCTLPHCRQILYRLSHQGSPESKKPLCQIVRAATTKYHKLSGLKQFIYCLTVLEARSPKSRCQQGHALSESKKGRNCSMPFSQFLSLRLSLTWSCITPDAWLSSPFESLYHPPAVRVCVQISCFLLGHQSYWIRTAFLT